jgi:hypothetical protein
MVGGIVIPSAFAVLRLMTNSNLVLAAFNLGEFRNHRPAAAIEIVQDGFALGIEPKARLALPIRRYPEIGDEFAPMRPANYGASPLLFRPQVMHKFLESRRHRG